MRKFFLYFFPFKMKNRKCHDTFSISYSNMHGNTCSNSYSNAYRHNLMSGRIFARTMCALCIICFTCINGCQPFYDANSAKSQSAENASAKFNALTGQYFCDELSNDTISLHYTTTDPAAAGIDDYSVTLGNIFSDTDDNSSKFTVDTDCDASSLDISYYLTALEEINRDALSDKEQLDYDVFCDYLTTQEKLEAFEYFSDSLSSSNGLQCELPVLLAEYDFRTENDIKEYLSLLRDFPRYFDELIQYETKKSKAGLFMSDEQCQKVIDECEDFIKNPDENILITTFATRVAAFSTSYDASGNITTCIDNCTLPCHNTNVSSITSAQLQEYIAENSNAVTQYVIPSYQKLIEALTNLLGTGKNPLGLSYYDDGTDYYETLVYATTGCDDSVDKIYESIEDKRASDLKICGKLLQNNPNLLDECTKLSSMTDTNVDCAFISTNTKACPNAIPINTIPINTVSADNSLSAEAMLDSLRDAMKQDFPPLDNAAYSVSYVDESLQDSLAPAFYLTAPIDDCNNNKIYINPARDHSQIGLFTTLAHEGFPGHLYQTVKSYEYGLSPFRVLLNYGGYTEGWATYVEMLSYKYAGLDNDVAAFLQNNHDFSLSLYATSDIGIHYYGWDYDELADFWDDYGIKDEASIKEIQSLILASPANYLKYYVGCMQFEKLKDAQRELLGNDFSETNFHEAVLRVGPASFSILDRFL